MATNDAEISEDHALSLGVRAFACRVFDDPSVAWALHEENHMILWRPESVLRVDRFDARNLLDDHSLFRRLKKKNGIHAIATEEIQEVNQTEEEKELHRLRYGDYRMEFPEEERQPAENKFPYQYPEDVDEEADGEPLHLPWTVPDGIRVPKTAKLHEILVVTANKVRNNPQLEVMLKVKLSVNPKFGFLQPSHGLHPYYCFVRDENPISAVKNAQKHPVISLLGEEYSDDSDDEEEDKQHEENRQETVQVDEIQQRQAMRLRRAKLLAGHFQHKALEKKHPTTETQESPKDDNDNGRITKRSRFSEQEEPSEQFEP